MKAKERVGAGNTSGRNVYTNLLWENLKEIRDLKA
jgi:hypothetical protein